MEAVNTIDFAHLHVLRWSKYIKIEKYSYHSYIVGKIVV